MNRGFKNELALIAGLASSSLLLTKKNKNLGVGLGLLSLGLRFFPTKPAVNFRKKSVIITGGSRGLGFALAEEFLNEGASVSLLARDHDELLKAQKLLKNKTGVEAFVCQCDVTNPDQLSDAFSRVIEKFGKIDILINNAGTVMASPLEAMEPKDYAQLMNLHFFAVQQACSQLIPYFKKRGAGHFVNISSVGGKIPVPHLSSYNASKFALAGYSHSLAIELAQHGINVTSVFPGLMRTGSTVQAIFKGDAKKEFAWFTLSDHTPGFSIPVRSAARTIVDGIRHREREVIISTPAKLGVLVFSIFPEIFLNTMILVNRLLPHGLSKVAHTGHESKDWIEGKIPPLKSYSEKLRTEFNQG